MRTCSEEDHLQLPDWIELANDIVKTKIQARAKEILVEMLEEEKEQERRRKIIKRLFPSGHVHVEKEANSRTWKLSD